MDVFISIIIPVYKVEKYLHRCLDSILSQSFSDIEVILIDDGSPDNCGSICDQYADMYPDKVRVIHQENRGLSGARNAGLSHSHGKYIFFVDSDDTIESDAIRIIFDALEMHGFPDMLIFDGRTVSQRGNVLSSRICGSLSGYRVPTGMVTSLENSKELLFEFPSAWSRVTKRDIFIKNNISFPLGLWFEDIGCTPMLLKCCESIVCIDKTLYNYFLHEGSITASSSSERRCNDVIAVFEVLIKWFKENNLFDEYYSQLEYMAVSELFVVQTVMIILSGGSYKYLDKLVLFMKQNFKGYLKNPYIKKIGKKNRFKVLLISKRCYFVVSAIFMLTRLRRRIISKPRSK